MEDKEGGNHAMFPAHVVQGNIVPNVRAPGITRFVEIHDQTFCPTTIRHDVTMKVPYAIHSLHHSDLQGFTALLWMALDLHMIS
jgi:hypothetical protein